MTALFSVIVLICR